MSNAAPTPPRPAVIRKDPLDGRQGALMELLRAMPAWLISAGIHAVLITLFCLFVINPKTFGKTGPTREPFKPIETKVEAPTQDIILTNIDEGINPELPTNYDVKRIEDVSVPGPVDPNAAVGIVGAPEGPPVTIPPPPGSGRGQGAALFVPNIDGTGIMGREIMGGYGGLRNIPGGFAGRSGSTREQMVSEGGGSKASEVAVAKGLMWLAKHQCPDGSWSLDKFYMFARADLGATQYRSDETAYKGGAGAGDAKYETAGTAFGLLPFLAAGITHKTSSKKEGDNQYVKTVAKAIDWLCRNQGKDGDFGGGMYSHGLATIAICEAYGLTSDPRLKAHAQAGLNYIITAQDPASGGWRYQPRQGGDTSVVGWQVMALKSGQMSGLNVPPNTLKGAEKWLDDCETSDKGGFGYTGPQETPTMTAVGLLCRQYLGVQRRNQGLQSGVAKLQRPQWTPGVRNPNIYYEYYATQVMHHMGGDYWDYWNLGMKDGKKVWKGMRDTLIDRQEPNGSFSPTGDGHSRAGGRVMQTSLSLLTLEVYYRHLPLYQRQNTKKQ